MRLMRLASVLLLATSSSCGQTPAAKSSGGDSPLGAGGGDPSSQAGADSGAYVGGNPGSYPGNGGGGGGGTGDDACAEYAVHATQLLPQMLIVMDRSLSMVTNGWPQAIA